MNSAIENLGMSADELREKIHTLMPKWLEDELDEFRYLSGGYSNLNVAFRRSYAASDRNNTLGTYYVLRLPRRPQPYVNRQAEAAWYKRMPESVGPAPLVLDVPSGQMITPWLSGDLLVDVFHQRYCEDDLTSYLQALHGQLPGVAEQYHVPTLVPQFLETGWPADIDRSIFVESGAHPLSRSNALVTCHNDLNPWNILVTSQGWKTLDWEFVGRNDPLFDLVALHQGLQLDEASLPRLAKVFLPSASPERFNRAVAQFWLREWCWASYQIRHGNRRAEIVEQERDAKRQLGALPKF